MPKSSVPKSKTGSKAGKKAGNVSADQEAICDGCCSAIVEDEREAIQCEGTCQKWYHRLCAGVSKFHYDELADSPRAFICWLCSDSLHRTVIQELQQELASLKANIAADVESSRSEIAALKEDNAALKAALDRKLSQLQPVGIGASGDRSATAATRSYASAARQTQLSEPRSATLQEDRGKIETSNSTLEALRHPVREQWTVDTVANKASTSPKPSGASTESASVQRSFINGVRRVWGTMPSTTTGAIYATLKKLTSIGNKISVRRKTRRYV